MSQLVTILLPASSTTFDIDFAAVHEKTKRELVKIFGGLTRYTQNPAEGLWKNRRDSTERDTMVVYEVMTSKLDKQWWRHYRKRLEARFKQQEIVIRSQKIKKL
jgi:hypothetical protein